jgi:hypothetical protein
MWGYQLVTNFFLNFMLLIDYAHFGDVMTFDTTFGTNRVSRPFGNFLEMLQSSIPQIMVKHHKRR